MSDEVVSTIDSLRDDLARLGVAPGDLLMVQNLSRPSATDP
ncbi:hypothetical protein BH24ACT6_BH24ACT6_10930 [soil metagenome]